MRPRRTSTRSQSSSRPQTWLACWLMLSFVVIAKTDVAAELIVSPAKIVLDSPEASQQLIVSVVTETGRRDVTGDVQLTVADKAVAAVPGGALVRPRSEGQTQIAVILGDEVVRVPVEVVKQRNPDPVSFRN